MSLVSKRKVEKTTNGSSYSFRLTFDEERLRTQVSMGNTYFAQDTYPDPDVYNSLTPYHLTKRGLRKYLQAIMQAIRTFHNHLHITHKTVDNTQCLCDSQSGLILGQAVQLLQNSFDFALPEQLLRKLLYGTLSYGQRTSDDALTEPSLLDLLRRKGKH
jgi:hypothetical protein